MDGATLAKSPLAWSRRSSRAGSNNTGVVHERKCQSEPASKGGPTVALSDQLTKLAGRAKEAEDRAAAAQTKAKAELEKDVKAARESAKAQADTQSKDADTGTDKMTGRWQSIRR